MTATMEFDPGAVTVEDVVALTGPRCREVLAHYEMPDPPKSWKVSELRKITAATVGAVKGASEPLPPVEEPPAPEPKAEKPGTEIEPAIDVKPLDVLPGAERWQQLVAIGEFIAKSGLCPKELRQKPRDVTIVLLAANDLGISITQAIDHVHVIHGRKGMSADLMRALARRDGHSIRIDPASNREFATVHGTRIDSGDEESATFTIEEAVHAGLCTIDADGNVRSRSKDGEKKPWESYTADMLIARATSRLCRRLFSDCIGGVSYTPEELGYIDADDTPGPTGDAPEPTHTVRQERDEIARRISELPGSKDDPESIMGRFIVEWKKRRFGKVESLSPAGIRQAKTLLDAAEEEGRSTEAAETDGIPDADVVTDGTAEDGATEGQETQEEPAQEGADPDAPAPDTPESGEDAQTDAQGEATSSTADEGNTGVSEVEPKHPGLCRTADCTMVAVTPDGYCDEHEVM